MERTHALGGLALGLIGLVAAVSLAVAMTAEDSTPAQQPLAGAARDEKAQGGSSGRHRAQDGRRDRRSSESEKAAPVGAPAPSPSDVAGGSDMVAASSASQAPVVYVDDDDEYEDDEYERGDYDDDDSGSGHSGSDDSGGDD